MTVDRPLVFVVVLAAAALLAVLYRRLERRAGAQALAYSSLAFAEQALRPRRGPALLLGSLWLAAALALALAASGTRVVARVPAADAWAVLCVDTSGSMASTDVAPTREGAARAALRAFVEAAPRGTRIGIVSFSGNAFVVAPPSDDPEQTRAAIERVPPANGATAIGDALLAANQLLPDHGTRIVVLMTDGVNNAGADPLEAAKGLAGRGIPVYTIGIGTNEGSVIPGTEQEAELDEDALQAIAATGGGRYVRVADAAQMRGTFRRLAGTTVWEPRRVDASLTLALAGAAALLAAFFTGFGLGKYP